VTIVGTRDVVVAEQLPGTIRDPDEREQLAALLRKLRLGLP
jgi:hypothetical protein